mmetsp:Transcript_18577/g.48441  ORF Transcript_18577/g.48441 Transcript_18577/m.48441 type:complete len:98 (-) Transcript_18577:86-379(-)
MVQVQRHRKSVRQLIRAAAVAEDAAVRMEEKPPGIPQRKRDNDHVHPSVKDKVHCSRIDRSQNCPMDQPQHRREHDDSNGVLDEMIRIYINRWWWGP